MNGNIKPHKLLHLRIIKAKHVGEVPTIIKGVMHGYYLPILVYSSTSKEKAVVKLPIYTYNINPYSVPCFSSVKSQKAEQLR